MQKFNFSVQTPANATVHFSGSVHVTGSTTAQKFAPATGGIVDKEDLENCPRCGKRVFFAEQILGFGRKWHVLCYKCGKQKNIVAGLLGVLTFKVIQISWTLM